MRKPRSEEEKTKFLKLREKRDKISKEMKKLNPEELKVYISERLNKEKEIPEKN